MSTAYTNTPNGKTIQGPDVQQLINGLTGVRAVAHTFLSDDASYALTLKSSHADANLLHLLDADDATVLRVTGSGITLAELGLTVQGNMAVQTGNFDATGGNATLAGAANNLGFFAAAGTTKQTVSGSRGGNAALGSLLAALASYGQITDSTTA